MADLVLDHQRHVVYLPRRPRRPQLALAACSIALSMVLAEIGLRVKNSVDPNYDVEMWRYSRQLKQRSSNPVLGHEHVAGATAYLQGTDIRLNNWGLRGPAVGPRRPDVRRILVLGSSITLGWGVPEAQTLTQLLEQHFRSDGAEVEVLNAGIGNYNAARYVALFHSRLQALDPTDVVVHYFINDAEQLSGGNQNLLLRHSQLAVALWSFRNAVSQARLGSPLLTHYRDLYRSGSPGREAMQQALAALAETARTRGIRLYLLMTPEPHYLQHYPFQDIHDSMEHTARSLGYTFVDALPALRELTPEQLWVTADDPHPNARGHRLMADTLYPYLQLPTETVHAVR